MHHLSLLTLLKHSSSIHCVKCLLRRTPHPRPSFSVQVARHRFLSGIASPTPAQKEWTEPDGHHTGIYVYNSLTKRKDELILPNGNYLSWYVCGPTVYDESHIGHASNYIRFDTIRRILQNFFDINITYMMGVTDIDDKIIKRAQELDQPFTVIASHYEREFFQEMSALNILPPTIISRVSDYVPEIITFIQGIIDRGHAYHAPDGGVYFDVNGYGRYPRFVRSVEGTTDSSDVKNSLADFALWKPMKPGEPYWDSPWGVGRPGWHIECSAMASRVFGSTIDMHSGGQDLMFPHHENELAQSCSYHNCGQWVNYWLHTGHLHRQYDPEKMSKSLKNVISTTDILKQYTANQFRMFCMLTHYRSYIEFTEERMAKAIILDKQIGQFLRQADAYVKGQLEGGNISEADTMALLATTQENVEKFLKDDFRTPDVMKLLFDLIHTMNIGFTKTDKVVRSPGTVGAVNVYVKRLCKKLGFHKKGWRMTKEPDNMKLKEVLDGMVKFRWEVRNFALQLPVPVHDGMTSKEKKAARQKVIGPLLDHCDNLRTGMHKYKINIQDHKTYSSWEFDDSGNVSEDSPWVDTDSDQSKASRKSTSNKNKHKKSAKAGVSEET